MTINSELQDAWPLSPLQEGLAFHALFDEQGLDVYTVQMAFELEGPLDAFRLRAAAQALLDRHSCLRVAFMLDHEPPVQVVVRSVQVPWTEIDLSDYSEEDRSSRLDRLMQDDWSTRFDLQSPPLLRFLLVKIDQTHYRLVLSNHHILWDGWSTSLVLGDLFALYASGGDGSGLSQVRPFRDHLVWLSTRDRATALAAWVQALKGVEEPTLLAAADRARPPVLAEQVDANISEDLTSRLTSFVRAHGLTMNTVIQMAWAVVLSRVVGRFDVVFGTTVSGRPPELPGVESMVGLFINAIPVRVRLNPAESLMGLLHRVQDEQSQLLDHQYLGLTEIQREVGVDTLFDTLTAFQSFPRDIAGATRSLENTGVILTGIDWRDSTHYPISLEATPGTRLEITLKYRPDIFDSISVQALADRVVRILEMVVTDSGARISEVDLLSADERHQLLAKWNGIAAKVPTTSLPELFAAQVARTPDNTAVIFEDVSLTYAELDARANELARHLPRRRGGVGDDPLTRTGDRHPGDTQGRGRLPADRP
jgi:Condensation domain